MYDFFGLVYSTFFTNLDLFVIAQPFKLMFYGKIALCLGPNGFKLKIIQVRPVVDPKHDEAQCTDKIRYL